MTTGQPGDHAEGLSADAVRVVSGNPTDEELAAVIAVLASVRAEGPAVAAPAPRRLSAWARSQRALRTWDHGADWS